MSYSAYDFHEDLVAEFVKARLISTDDLPSDLPQPGCIADENSTSIESSRCVEALHKLLAERRALRDALAAFLRAPSIGSAGPGSSTIVVQDFNLRAARAALLMTEPRS